MLSDEEKKAIEYIKNCLDNEYDFKNATRQKDKKAYNIILNLIEKQQKEIEELKKYEEGYKLLSYSLDNYISKDKIKAKIEELEKLDFGTDLVSQFTANLTTITILQSLLEKE